MAFCIYCRDGGQLGENQQSPLNEIFGGFSSLHSHLQCALTTTFLCVPLPGGPFFLYRDSPLYQRPILTTSCTLNFFFKGSNIITLEVKASTHEFWEEGHKSVHTSDFLGLTQSPSYCQWRKWGLDIGSTRTGTDSCSPGSDHAILLHFCFLFFFLQLPHTEYTSKTGHCSAFISILRPSETCLQRNNLNITWDILANIKRCG